MMKLLKIFLKDVAWLWFMKYKDKEVATRQRLIFEGMKRVMMVNF